MHHIALLTVHLMTHMVFVLATADNFGISTWLNQWIGLLTGPVAMFIAIICILGGCAMFAQGREGHEGLKNLGMIGIAVGVLAAMPRIWAAFGGATSGIRF